MSEGNSKSSAGVYIATALITVGFAFLLHFLGDYLEQLGINVKVTIVIVVAFAILFMVLHRFLFKKIGTILDEREKYVQDKYREIDDKRQHVEGLVQQYEQKLQDIEKQALEKMQEAVKEGIAKRDQIIEQAKKDMASEMERTRKILESDRQRLKEELKNQTGILVVKAVKRLLPDIIDDQIQQKILDKFEQKLKQTPSEELTTWV